MTNCRKKYFIVHFILLFVLLDSVVDIFTFSSISFIQTLFRPKKKVF